jgi:cGMP-dependent protein kinase
VVGQVGAFKGLQAHELKDLAEALESQVFQPADVLTQVGDHGDQFFLIEGGTAKMLMSSHQETYIGKGNFFGEVSFLYKNMKRSATVMAVTELHTLTLRRADFVSRVSNFAQYLTTLEEAAKNEQLTLKDLTVIKTLGLGQFGRVKLVRNNRTGQHHALKCMKKADIGRQGQVQHVRDENIVMKSLEHPFIIKLVATFKDDTTVYMLMDLCLGGELFSLLNDAPNGFFANDMARFYAAQVTLKP